MISLLYFLGCLSNVPGVFFAELEGVHMMTEGMVYLQNHLDWKKKKQLTAQQYSAWIARRRAEHEQLADSVGLSRWVCPTFHLSTEQYSGFGVMFKLPWSSENHLFWAQPSVYEIGAPLFFDFGGNYDVEDKFFRWSVGIGYRYLMNPHTRLGIYGYYDYTTRNELLEYASRSAALTVQFLHHPHIFNVGVEIFTPLGRLIGNVYGNSTLTIDKGDVKWVIDWGRFTFAIGAYGGQRDIQGVSNLPNGYGMPKDVRVIPIDFRIGSCGVALEWKYKRDWKTYGIKYTYDNSNKHRLSYAMQWEFNSPCWMPTERYLEASQSNVIGIRSIFKKAADQARVEHMSSTKAPQIRRFRNIFAKRYGNTCALQAIEKDTLERLKRVPKMKDTAVLLDGSSKRVLGDVYSAYRDITIKDKDFEDIFTKGNQLQKLYLARSILHNISWVELLNRQGLVSIGVSEDDQEFNPSQKQLATINEFAAISNYFTPFQSKMLNNWSDWRGIMAGNMMLYLSDYMGEVPYHPFYKSVVGIAYHGSSVGHRLVLLEKIAREVLPYYKSSNINLSQASIISMQQKLNKSITSNLHWQCTAALCSDFSFDQRKTLFYLAHLPRLPYEARKEILQYVIRDLIDPSVISDRLDLLRQDLQLSNESESAYAERLYRCWTDRLLLYLSSIETDNDYRDFLAIPDNPYGILF